MSTQPRYVTRPDGIYMIDQRRVPKLTSAVNGTATHGTAIAPRRALPDLGRDEPPPKPVAPTSRGDIRLTNFCAKIVEDRAVDDGVQVAREYEIEATLGERQTRFVVPASAFDGLGWVATCVGAEAIVFPGPLRRDHVAAAIRRVSGPVPTREVVAHLGWRKQRGRWVYLHAGGTIGADEPAGRADEGPRAIDQKPHHDIDFHRRGPDGPMGPEGNDACPTLEVRVEPPLDQFVLPRPVSESSLRQALWAVLLIEHLAPTRVTLPLLALIARAPVGEVHFAGALVGPTGTGKSELASIAQRFWGPAMHARRLPGSWSSTPVALEALAYAAKDAILVIDDFVPNGAHGEIHRLNRSAEHLLRGLGNGSGRARGRSDGSYRAARPPRGLVLSTGEESFSGASLNARLITLELARGELKWDLLSSVQRYAESGLFAAAMAAYVAWLAPQLDEARGRMRDFVAEARSGAAGDSVRRITDASAELAFAFNLLLEFAEDAGAIDEVEHQRLWERCNASMLELGGVQEEHQVLQDPVEIFLALLAEGLGSGRCHLAGPDGSAPEEDARALGWRGACVAGELDEGFRTVWHSRGERCGWTDGLYAYLLPGVALAQARRLAHDTGRGLEFATERTLGQKLDARGLLEVRDINRGKYTTRRWLEGARRSVYMLRLKDLVTLSLEPGAGDRLAAGTTLEDVLVS